MLQSRIWVSSVIYVLAECRNNRGELIASADVNVQLRNSPERPIPCPDLHIKEIFVRAEDLKADTH